MSTDKDYIRDSTEVVMANAQTIMELLSRSDISPYARAAMERLLTDLTCEIARRARGGN